MNYTRRKAEWVRKLVKTKSFIIITDSDAGMNIRGTEPNKLNLFEIAMQRAHLAGFRDRIDRLIREHDALLGVSIKKKPAKKPVRKIKVKKG